MQRQLQEVITDFEVVLYKIWDSDYFVHHCWVAMKKLSRFKGNDLMKFAQSVQHLTDFLATHFEEDDPEITSLTVRLGKLKPIVDFLVLTRIDSTDEVYLAKIQQITSDVTVLYSSWKDTFLRQAKRYNETFYFHCLRFYFPKLASDNFKRCCLGLGIFSMQGFERRNLERKRRCIC